MELEEARLFTELVKALNASRDRNEVLRCLPIEYMLVGSDLDKSTAEIVFQLRSRLKLTRLRSLLHEAFIDRHEQDVAAVFFDDYRTLLVTTNEPRVADKEVATGILERLAAAELRHLRMVLCILGTIKCCEVDESGPCESASGIVDTLMRRHPDTWPARLYHALRSSDLECLAEELRVQGPSLSPELAASTEPGRGATTSTEPATPVATCAQGLTAGQVNRKLLREIENLLLKTVNRLEEGMWYCNGRSGITDDQHSRIKSATNARCAFVASLVETVGRKGAACPEMVDMLYNCLSMADDIMAAEALDDAAMKDCLLDW